MSQTSTMVAGMMMNLTRCRSFVMAMIRCLLQPVISRTMLKPMVTQMIGVRLSLIRALENALSDDSILPPMNDMMSPDIMRTTRVS